jgi:hypothetical protein
MRKPGLYGRQAFAPNPAAVAQDGAPAAAGVAAQKSVLPFPANFRRLILSFHKSVPPSHPARLYLNDPAPGNTPSLRARKNNSERLSVKRGKRQQKTVSHWIIAVDSLTSNSLRTLTGQHPQSQGKPQKPALDPGIDRTQALSMDPTENNFALRVR